MTPNRSLDWALRAGHGHRENRARKWRGVSIDQLEW